VSSSGQPLIGLASTEEFWALKDVSFDVQQGERVGIIGRNGAGKTTLLKLLSRITEPTTGKVYLKGRVASLLEVGTGFHPELTGRENVFLNGAILGMSKAEITKKFDEIVAFAEVEKFLDTPVKRYSSGMYVRLAFAVAAHLEPEILVVDEVLAVGDAAFQKKCLGKMEEVGREGRTVLFVSHNMQAVLSLCTKAMLISHGRLDQVGEVQDIIDRYVSSFDHYKGLSVNIGHLPRRPGEGEHFIITRIELNPTENEVFKVWEPLKVRLHYKCTGPISDVVPGISILKLDGTCLFTCDSQDNQLFLSCEKGDSGIVEVTVSDPGLIPGTYILRTGARIGLRTIDWVDGPIAFDVVPIPTFSSMATRPTLGLRPQSCWNFGTGSRKQTIWRGSTTKEGKA